MWSSQFIQVVLSPSRTWHAFSPRPRPHLPAGRPTCATSASSWRVPISISASTSAPSPSYPTVPLPGCLATWLPTAVRAAMPTFVCSRNHRFHQIACPAQAPETPEQYRAQRSILNFCSSLSIVQHTDSARTGGLAKRLCPCRAVFLLSFPQSTSRKTSWSAHSSASSTSASAPPSSAPGGTTSLCAIRSGLHRAHPRRSPAGKAESSAINEKSHCKAPSMSGE